jgi:hypothetical protein
MDTLPLILNRNNHRWYSRLALAPVVMLAIYAVSFLINPNGTYCPGWSGPWRELAISLSIDFFFCWLIIEVSIGIAHLLERFYPWESVPLVRFLIQTILILLVNGCIFWTQDRLYSWLYPGTLTPQQILEVWQFFIVNLIIGLMISAFHTSYYLLQRWKTTLEEAGELKIKTLELSKIALQAELQSLKLQLDPHFLFNNFSTLSELILEDPAKASLFLDNLSKVYRYMIQTVKQDLVSLKDEITFVKAYYYLIQIRHGEQVRICFDLNLELISKWLPPITLQLLIENAIKHNRATLAEPLTIEISHTGTYLCVSNNRQPFPTPLPSTGLGLENIKNRYQILSSQIPAVGSDAERFWVKLPLLDPCVPRHYTEKQGQLVID